MVQSQHHRQVVGQGLCHPIVSRRTCLSGPSSQFAAQRERRFYLRDLCTELLRYGRRPLQACLAPPQHRLPPHPPIEYDLAIPLRGTGQGPTPIPVRICVCGRQIGGEPDVRQPILVGFDVTLGPWHGVEVLCDDFDDFCWQVIERERLRGFWCVVVLGGYGCLCCRILSSDYIAWRLH